MNTECFHEVPPVPPGIYEPHCLMTWREMVAGMDDTIIDPEPDPSHPQRGEQAS